jgi:hypothetical protein
MKKIISIFIAFLLCVSSLSSCYQDLYYDSLEDYITRINKHKNGYSGVEIDRPNYFLPSDSFLEDYNYIEGKFVWLEDDPFRGLFTTNVRPEISFLCLKYKDNIYYNAKQFMLEKIEPYNDKFYTYNNYIFYENTNFINLKGGRNFPDHFTMACYNDQNYTLFFIGLYAGTLAGPSCLEEKYLNDIDNNWMSFIDTYYGEYFDFSK